MKIKVEVEGNTDEDIMFEVVKSICILCRDYKLVIREMIVQI